MEPAIEISNLMKRYGDMVALKGIDLRIEQGCFFGLLGPNGAGKTTTINIITGLVRYSHGTVRVLGGDVERDFRFTRSKIGLSTQEFNFDPFFNIHQLLVFQGGYFGVPWKRARSKAEELLKQFGLWEKRDGNYRKLSGGMKRRLQIAKALVHNPDILILDEPTAGVDVELRHALWEYLVQLKNEGKTIVLTTHYIEEAEHLCERVAIINDGEIITEDTPENLKSSSGDGCIEVKLLDTIPGVPEFLISYKASMSGNTLRVYLKHPKRHLQGIIELFNMHNFRLGEISIREDSLEDVFIQLTGRSIDEGNSREGRLQ